MLNFNSMQFVPFIAWKNGVILCHFSIAKSNELFNLEVEKLRQMFYKNGYPGLFSEDSR